MGDSAIRRTLRIQSASVARLTVEGDGAAFGLRSDRQVHALGFRDAPRFWLEQSPYPDDEPWDVDVEATGRLAPGGSELPEELRPLVEWARGSRAEGGLGAIALLPPGTYDLVRCPLEPTAEAEILLGNEWVESPPNARTLLDTTGSVIPDRPESGYFACVFGAEKAAPPALDQALVGVAVLSWTGEVNVQALLLVPFAAAGGGAATGDLVLAVPRAGELVLDNMAAFSADASRKAFRRWETQLADDIVRRLAGGER